ncbi:MAG: acyl carrier protein [Gemmatimonadota bacterium]
MDNPELSEQVLAVLRRVVPVAPATIDPRIPFREQFEMDSLDFLNFVLALEKEFGVKIPAARYPRCANLEGSVAVLGACPGHAAGRDGTPRPQAVGGDSKA